MDFHHADSGCFIKSLFYLRSHWPERSGFPALPFDLGSVDLEGSPLPRAFPLARRCWFFIRPFGELVRHPRVVLVVVRDYYVPQFVRDVFLILVVCAFRCGDDADEACCKHDAD